MEKRWPSSRSCFVASVIADPFGVLSEYLALSSSRTMHITTPGLQMQIHVRGQLIRILPNSHNASERILYFQQLLNEAKIISLRQS